MLHAVTLTGLVQPTVGATVESVTKVWPEPPMYQPEFELVSQSWYTSSNTLMSASETFEGAT